MTDIITSTTGGTTQLAALSFLTDISSLVHGKGGLEKVVPALDLIEKFASLAAEIYPPSAAIAAGIGAAVQVGEQIIQTVVTTVTPAAEEPAAPADVAPATS